VQGDERDVVMIPVAFAPIIRTGTDGTPSRRLPLNFGPLNRRGGERRLNVAVTRARCEVTVFCSFDPEEMQLAETPAKGIELLKQNLSIARTSPALAPVAAVSSLPMPPLVASREIAKWSNRSSLR
jgi:superfamily I DNA and/or RNA helicase